MVSLSSSLSFQRRSCLCRMIIISVMMILITIHITTTTNPNCFMSNAFTLLALQYPSSSSLLLLRQQTKEHQQQQQQLEQSYESDTSRRHTLLHRRMMIQQQLHLLPILIISVPTIAAAAAAESSSKEEQDNEELLNTQIHEAFMKLQNELNVNTNNNSNGGGIYILQQYIQNENYNDILEYTKTYDPKLRKGIMKPIQQLLIQKVNLSNKDNDIRKKEQTKYIQTQTTTYMNAITFDLIGINRNARSQQINNIQLQKYLYELQNDIQSFLQLEHIV